MLLLIMLLLDWYVFQAVKVSFLDMSLRVRTGSRYAHWLISVFCITVAILGFSGYLSSLPKSISTYLYAFIAVLYLSKIFVVFFLLIDDIIRLFRWVCTAIGRVFYSGGGELPPKVGGIDRLQFLNRLALAIGFIPFAALVYGMARGAFRYRVEHIKISINKAHPALKGLKIVQVSDIHSGSFTSKEPLQRAVQMINDLQPDIILFTGDLVNNHAEEVIPHIETLQQLKAPLGKYSIFGNHDYGDYVQWDSKEEKSQNLERLKGHHQEAGFKLMLNESLQIAHNGHFFNLVGIENWGAYGRFSRYGDLEKAMTGISQKDVNILMSHDPSHWTEVISKDYPHIDLTLSGHTHGFQFGIEIPGFKWSPVKYMYPHWAGLYKGAKNNHLYVNRGLGFLGYPGRVGIWPEITLIEVV